VNDYTTKFHGSMKKFHTHNIITTIIIGYDVSLRFNVLRKN